MAVGMLIDSHCHLDFSDFDADRDLIVNECAALSIHHFIIPGTTAARFESLISLARQTATFSFALGLHPYFMDEHEPAHLDQLEALLVTQNVCAVGEIGLDFYLPETNKAAQVDLFLAQLSLACQYQLPVILHVRKAHDEMTKLLRDYRFSGGGIVHAFTGSVQQAERYIELGFCLGLGGSITYPRANKVRKMAAALPDTCIVLETDSPDMPLSGYQGQRNTPAQLVKVAQQLAQLRGQSVDDIARLTTANVERTLGINAIKKLPKEL